MSGMTTTMRSGNAHRRRFLLTLAAGAAGTLGPARAAAPPFPSRPLSYIVAYTPGSANDILVRLVAPELGRYLGQNVIVENKPGAGGTIGMSAVARARADGYTLGLGSTATLAVNRALYKHLPYDPLADFLPVIKLASTPNVLVVPAASPMRTARDLLRRLKSPAARLSFSSSGSGTTQHLAGLMFANLGGGAEHIPFKGPTEAVTALVAGHVDFSVASLPSSAALIREGRLRALGITSRAESLPGVPTLDSQGCKGFDKTDVWFGIVVPAGTPAITVEALHDAAAQALSDPALRARLQAAGYEAATPASAAEFARLVQEQTAFWAQLVQRSGAEVD